MRTPKLNRTLLVIVAVLIAAIVVANCGRTSQQVGDVSAPALSSSTQHATPVTEAPATEGPATVAPRATDSNGLAAAPGPGGPAPAAAAAPTSTPISTPDLTSIEALLSGINTDLGADASADTNEGSAP
ncbi:MAG: hypothetical protein ABI555_09430 [Chloroflexota bacterium]